MKTQASPKIHPATLLTKSILQASKLAKQAKQNIINYILGVKRQNFNIQTKCTKRLVTPCKNQECAKKSLWDLLELEISKQRIYNILLDTYIKPIQKSN